MNADELRAENEALRHRLTTLTAAILRVGGSLDLRTVLQEVVDGARELTQARYGLIATVGPGGQPEPDFVTSGLSAEEHQTLGAWPDAVRLFERLRELPDVVRVRELPSYVSSLGFSSALMPSEAYQGTPMRHRGVYIGHFFLAGKEGGGEFTTEDEAALVLFASQAAAAIANARTFRDEQRARADLQALIDTSPVGVAVFDARKRRLVSLNREAKRIGAALAAPGQSTERLLEEARYRRGDGREGAFEDFWIACASGETEFVRAEEIVLSVPDGRCVTLLVNATPIRAEDGSVESVVVTMQDLAPLEELERLRTEFLGLVGHELRAPLSSIKGSAATVLGATPVPGAAEMLQFFRLINQQADSMHGLIGDLLDAGRIETGTLSVAPEPVAVVDVVEQARTLFLSGGGRHTIQIDLPPELTPVMADGQRIVQVLNNLFANAARHSSESSPIRVRARQDEVHIAIEVSDQGRGISPELMPHLFRKYSLTRGEEEPSGIRATGLGLSICRGLVEAHGGRIWAESDGQGHGARFTFTIPVAEAPAVLPRRPAGPSVGAPEGTRILVVDDDTQTLRYVRDALAAARYSPVVTSDPGEVSHLLQKKKPQLVLLDLVLPGTDGIALMEDIPDLADVPVIFISAYGRDETIARALERGASDYIVKPFSPTELVARVRAALRRSMDPEPFRLRDLAIHYEERRVTFAGSPIQLTATEYELLRVLSMNAGRVETYGALLRRVWHRRDRGDVRLVRSFVKRLRRLLGDDPNSPVYIITERGVGYRMPKPGDG